MWTCYAKRHERMYGDSPRILPFKVAQSHWNRYATYDFLFLIHIEWINDDLRFRSKIANFFTSQAFNVPAEGFAFEICNGVEV